MRPPPRRSRTRLLALIGLFFFIFSISFLFLAIVPADFSPPLQHKQLIGDNSIAWKKNVKLNSIRQEINGGLKVPPGIVLKDSNYNELVNDLRDDGADGEVKQQNIATFADGKEQSNQASAGELSGLPRQHPIINEQLSEMEDQIIMARAYLQFAPANSNSHLVRELKLRIKEMQKIIGHSSGSNLPSGALQKMRAMEETLSKASKAYPDCSAMASKLRAMTQNIEERLTAQKNQASYLTQLAASTFPKGLHCLSMRLTTQYFSLNPEERQFPNRNKVLKEDLHHYAIFSDNVLACTVVVNSTISSSKAQDSIVFHVVTDSLNFPAMTMWFLMNPPGHATIAIQSMDDFKWLPPDFYSTLKQSDVQDPRFISPLNYLRFYLPDVFPHLHKILLLDHDVVVQKDLRRLWKIDMKGKVIGVVETRDEDAFGMNMVDLHEWRRRGLTRVYSKWLRLGKAGSLALGRLTFYDHTVALDGWWHVAGLGRDLEIEKTRIERAAVIHYSGNRKPWLEIGVSRFRGYWNRFLKYDQPFLQQCNIHE